MPVDLGGTLATGIHGATYLRLKEALGISGGETRINEPFQFLAEIEAPVKDALHIDTFGLFPPSTMFGYRNENWKPFTFTDGTTVKVSGNMQWDVLENGDIVQYPRGDRSAAPSGRMPRGGSFFDTIIRQEPIVEEELDAKEFARQTFSLYTEEECRRLEETTKWVYDNTDYSIVGSFMGASFSRLTEIMGPFIANPKGIRAPEEWFMSFLLRKDYIREIHELQYEVGMKNLEMYKQAVGNRIDVVLMSGTDFGTQTGLMFGTNIYREFFKEFHSKMNGWVHENTDWKTFYHTCGSIRELLDDFYEAGIDILNPVQVSAAGMDPRFLKDNYGSKFVFWGGGVDTQNILPFESEANVRKYVREMLEIFAPGGGYVFSTVHNIQDKVPIGNVVAAFDEVARFRY
ncbi:MAG: uroporphyrinogen decarboxylase family protein [Rectinemataceae bacterium]